MTAEPHDSPLDRLLRTQAGVGTRAQLVSAGMTLHQINAQVGARRWQCAGDHCIVTHNFVPSREQQMWVAVLDPVVPVALAGVTSLETAGFKFFGSELDSIHVVFKRGARPTQIPGVRLHESRRFFPEDIDPSSALPRTLLPRSALDAGAWQPFPRYACGLLAAGVQQKICTVGELGEQMQFVGRIRHKAHMRLALHDIGGGAEALSEIDIADLCRTYGLRPPDRQRIRRDPRGRKRYLDCEWVLDDATIVVLEVDGGHHMQVEHWGADMKRERGVVITGRRVLRATSFEARHEQAELAADLQAIGVPTCQKPRRL